MAVKSVVATDFADKPSQCAGEALLEQILWLIRLRWIAVGGMIAAALLGTHVFLVLSNPAPIYACAAALLISNILYFLAATKKAEETSQRDLALGMIQVELDLLILTAVLHYSGGVVNPFFLFYIFHVIIAAIILPRNLSFCVGLTAILLFGLLEVNELSGGTLLKGYHPLVLSGAGGVWRDPAYELGAFGAFACTVVLAQYLTRMIITRMTAEHNKLEASLRERTEELTKINEILKTSRLEMAQREKMVAIGQMAAGIAHEIGNPLASLSSVAQYLCRKLTVQEQKEHLLVIQYHVSRISNILKRMLSLSRPAASEYRWTDINELIDNTLSLINFDKRARAIVIKSMANPDLPALWLNPQHFEQVFLNIFINALDAMDAKQSEQEHVLEITTELKDGMVEIRTSDTGIGMSPEVCRRAFESFFTTKEVGKGTGLGLFISYNLVTEAEGTIVLESEPGKGTTVIIRIPPRTERDFMEGQDVESGLLNRARAV